MKLGARGMKSGSRGMALTLLDVALGNRGMELTVLGVKLGGHGINVGFQPACNAELNPSLNKDSFYKHFHNSNHALSDTTE
jgi:hypothetical protein